MANDTRQVQRVVDWFEANARPLPWRSTTPWGVFVSEFMLQQTPVARVEPAWHAWLERWPTPADLAQEAPGEAVRAWGRLGYPRRALRLHASAQVITDQHNGNVPSDEAELRALPGVGEYTAAAVRAFAFGLPSVVLDVNVRRVISRAWSGSDEPGSQVSSVERALAQVLMEASADPARWAAASMELGALVCTKRTPQCGSCPLRRTCSWRAAGFPEATGAPRRQARYEGSDRHARGLLLAQLREAKGSLAANALLACVPDLTQAERALASLIADGLVVQVDSGRVQLP